MTPNPELQKELETALENVRQNGPNYGAVDENTDPITSVAEEMGLNLTRSGAYLIWRGRSERVAAGWIHPDDKEEIEREITHFIRENQ